MTPPTSLHLCNPLIQLFYKLCGDRSHHHDMEKDEFSAGSVDIWKIKKIKRLTCLILMLVTSCLNLQGAGLIAITGTPLGRILQAVWVLRWRALHLYPSGHQKSTPSAGFHYRMQVAARACNPMIYWDQEAGYR